MMTFSLLTGFNASVNTNNRSNAAANLHLPSTVEKSVQSGTYEIQSYSTNLFLNSIESPVYNGWCDDALSLQDAASRNGKWEIVSVGKGYTIKQVSSGLYCAVANAEKFLRQHVVLSAIPTVWNIVYLAESTNKVHISWSVSEMSWEAAGTSHDHTVAIGKHPSDQVPGGFVWNLKPVGAVKLAGKLPRGIYAIQNKKAKTFLALSPDEKTLGCWPKTSFVNENTQLWEVEPLGEGYALRIHGTNKFCTLLEGMSNHSPVGVASVPAGWTIVPVDSPIVGGDGFYQIFWANTRMVWDLDGYGSSVPGTPVKVQEHSNYEECRVFQFIETGKADA